MLSVIGVHVLNLNWQFVLIVYAYIMWCTLTCSLNHNVQLHTALNCRVKSPKFGDLRKICQIKTLVKISCHTVYTYVDFGIY